MPSPENTRSRQKRILICAPGIIGYNEQQILLGIRRFTLTQPTWRLGDLRAWNAEEADVLKGIRSWKPDGVLIVGSVGPFAKLKKMLAVPCVMVDLRHEQPDHISRVCMDEEAFGERAADFFYHNGYRNLAIALWPGNPPFSRFRENGFTTALRHLGVTPSRFEFARRSDRQWVENDTLAAWLKSLPKPVGVFCVNEGIALRILEQCELQGIRVPTEVSVLATGNDPYFCETARPTISTIEHRYDLIGTRAASLLAEGIKASSLKKQPEVTCEKIPPGELVIRNSTHLNAIQDPAIAKAVYVLQEHALEGISIDDTARAAGLNRRALERGFRQHMGMTPGDFMQQVKIDHAKRLITETKLRMCEIAEACDMTPEYFTRYFRKATGTTPLAYRKGTVKQKKPPPLES